MKKEIKQTWHFKQSPEEIWKYLTRPELIEQWLGKTDFQPIVGRKFYFFSPSCNNTFCEVLEVEPFVKLSYSWQKNSAVDGKPFNSKIEWRLIPKENGTELQLTHGDFTSPEDFSTHENGWNTCHKQLVKLLSNNI